MKSFFTKVFIGIACIGLLTNCAIDAKIRGNRNVISLEREVTAPFDKVKVSQGIKLYLSLEEEASIYVEADENLHEYIKTEINSEGLLKVYIDGFISSSKARKVYVSTPDIQLIKASSGSSVISENTLMSDHLELKSSSGSSIELEVDSNDLIAKSASGSSIELSGSTNNYVVSSSSGSSIDSYELESSSAIAETSSGASIRLFVKNELSAKSSSGGIIKYKGNAALTNHKTSSGGSISKR